MKHYYDVLSRRNLTCHNRSMKDTRYMEDLTRSGKQTVVNIERGGSKHCKE